MMFNAAAKIIHYLRFAGVRVRLLGASLCCVIVLGCSQSPGSQPATYLPTAGDYLHSSAGTWSFRTVHAFSTACHKIISCVTFWSPQAGIDLNGVLYGTTRAGVRNGGTFFAVGAHGTLRTLYRFGRPGDGSAPNQGLIAVNGTIYGTTWTCGKSARPCDGTVFSISSTGNERVLHRFGAGADGVAPAAGLVFEHGTFYGTTFAGGKYGAGTVFSVTLSGKERVLYNFTGGLDGGSPLGGLIAWNGKLFGTTSCGGAFPNGPCDQYSGHLLTGTVFSLDLSGKERVLHSFGGSKTDGVGPTAGLTEMNGVLYGTTQGGGANGGGIVFSITMSGSERILHSFGKGNDGAGVTAGLTAVNGALYGTTYAGGIYYKRDRDYGGTVFSVNPSGVETIVHSFRPSDGWGLQTSVVDVGGSLYGATWGASTLFVLTPPA